MGCKGRDGVDVRNGMCWIVLALRIVAADHLFRPSSPHLGMGLAQFRAVLSTRI